MIPISRRKIGQRFLRRRIKKRNRYFDKLKFHKHSVNFFKKIFILYQIFTFLIRTNNEQAYRNHLLSRHHASISIKKRRVTLDPFLPPCMTIKLHSARKSEKRSSVFPIKLSIITVETSPTSSRQLTTPLSSKRSIVDERCVSRFFHALFHHAFLPFRLDKYTRVPERNVRNNRHSV